MEEKKEKPNLQRMLSEGFTETPTCFGGLIIYAQGMNRILYDGQTDEVVKRYVFVKRRKGWVKMIWIALVVLKDLLK